MKLKQKNAIAMLSEACRALEWDIAFSRRAKTIRGMVIGERAYINRILRRPKKKQSTQK